MQNWNPAFLVNRVLVFSTVGPWWTFDFCQLWPCAPQPQSQKLNWIYSACGNTLNKDRQQFLRTKAMWLQRTCCATFWHLNSTYCTGGAIITCSGVDSDVLMTVRAVNKTLFSLHRRLHLVRWRSKLNSPPHRSFRVDINSISCATHPPVDDATDGTPSRLKDSTSVASHSHRDFLNSFFI